MAPRILRALATSAPFVIGLIGGLILLLAAVRFIGSSGFSYDFSAYDLAARRIGGGAQLYPAGVAEAYNSGAYANLYLYAPPLAVVLLPVTVLDPSTAALTWLWLRVGLLVLGCAILPASWRVRAATLGVAGLSFPVLFDLNLGNLSIVLFMLSAVIWRFRDRPAASIALAAILTVRYSFAIVLISWFVRRRWVALAWAIGTGVAIGLVTLPFVGLDGWLRFLSTLSGLRDVSSGPHNITLADTLGLLGIGAAPKTMLVLVSIAAALAVTAVAARTRDAEASIVVALTATILFAPFLHPHYMVELLIPAAFLASRGAWWGLVLPLLGWLPGELLPVVGFVATLAPFVVARPRDATSVEARA